MISTAPFRPLHNPKQLTFKNPEIMGGNYLKLADGINQSKAVLPPDPTMPGNKKKIGFFHANLYDTAVETFVDFHEKPDLLTRKVTISLRDTSHMHNVPVLHDGYHWCIQHERQGIWKTPWMGWTFVSDDYSKRLSKFGSLDHAISYCRRQGLDFEVKYPHFRPHAKKNYGDNFKWKGNPKSKEEDL